MKRIKMLLYGEPGVGKSVFASKAPKPFFITTDGNYEWLEDFGAKPEDHIQVNSWEEAKQAFLLPLDNYETIVVDLLEDLFKWCEFEFCTKSKLEHISDIGYGKGYDITRNEYFIEIAKLLARDKHIILITHGITYTTKDRRGVEHTKHAPSSRIPDKVLDMIEGRLRYCLRCYLKAEEQPDGTLIKKRFLSLVPKESEFGIARGLDENAVPHDIPLEFDEFAKWIGLNNVSAISLDKLNVAKDNKVEVKEEPAKVEPVKEEKWTEQYTDKVVTVEAVEAAKQQLVADDVPKTEVKPVETKLEVRPETADIVNVEPAQPVTEEKPQSNADKIAAIKAKLARMNAQNNN